MSKVARTSSSSELLLKLIIIGDSGVGKSKTLMRLCDEEFKSNYTPTIGVNGRRLKFQIWDTAGQERYRTITQTYYKGAHGVLLVYSVTDRKSFESVGIHSFT
jgi:small GTP-binding protein